MKAVLCPVCNGIGKYLEKTCHGCSGKGWVEMQDNFLPFCPSPYAPYKPYPYPYYEPYETYPWTDTGDPLPPDPIFT